MKKSEQAANYTVSFECQPCFIVFKFEINLFFLFLQSGAAKYTVGSMLVFFLFLVSSASAADMCPGEPRCTCKWSGGKNTVDCSNAGKKSVLLVHLTKISHG